MFLQYTDNEVLKYKAYFVMIKVTTKILHSFFQNFLLNYASTDHFQAGQINNLQACQCAFDEHFHQSHHGLRMNGKLTWVASTSANTCCISVGTEIINVVVLQGSE